MRFTTSIDLDNAAFQDIEELPRILTYCAELVSRGPQEDGAGGSLRDLNGSTVGRWSIEA